MFEITKDQFDRTIKMLREIAKENGKVEVLKWVLDRI